MGEEEMINPTYSRKHKQNLKDRDSYLNAQDYWEGHFRGEEVLIKTGFVCPVCKKSTLAYYQPKNCEQHED